jgi:CHAT domain-containing protein
MRQAASQLDRTREALPAYQRMGAELERNGRFAEAAIAYTNAATAARALGRLQDDVDASQKALAMAERVGKPGPLANALNHLGWAYNNVNAPQKAMAVFEQAVRYASESGLRQTEAVAYDGLSWAYRRMGQPNQALDSAAKAVGILEEALQGNKSESGTSATPTQRQLANLDWQYARVLLDLGSAHVALRQWDPARTAFQKALDVGTRLREPFLTAMAHSRLATVAYRQGNRDVAVRHLEEAVRLAPRPSVTASNQGFLGRLYRDQGRLPEAEAALRQAIAGIEDLRGLLGSEELRETFFEDKTEPYELLALTLVDQGKATAAFDVSERARARAFLDLLGNRVTLSRGRSAALLAEEQALREQISALKAASEEGPAPRQALEEARAAYTTFLQRVRQADREQAALMTVEPLTLPQVQALLPEGAVLLAYFVTGEQQTLLWSVERGRVSVVTLPFGRGGITDRVQAFRALIASRGQEAETQRQAQVLFRQLVRPGLQGRTPTELLIVPHASLHYLPFQALMPTPDRYLIQEVPIAYYSSASLIQFTRAKAQAAPPTVFALGNPDLHDPTLNLRYAEREVRAVADLFPGTLVVTGAAATKPTSRAESPHHRLLHFATHAELDEQDPLGSALRLAPTPADDGRWEVQEIFGLNLNANLVVLSACETALGKLTRGDELTGLTRAFIYAGTPSIITTLWQVNDRASYALMQAFYGYLKGGMTKAEALRQAQLATLATYPHPYYWAAYQLTGEGR